MQHRPSSRKLEQEFRQRRHSNPLLPNPRDSAARPEAARRKHLRGLYVRWLWPYRFALLGVFLLALVTAALDMVWPLAMGAIINLLSADIPDGEKFRRLNVLGAAVVIVLVAKQGLESYRSYRTTVLNSKVTFRLRHRLFERLLNLSMSDLAEMKTGGIVSRLSSDVESVSGLVQMALISPGVAAIRVLLTVCVLFRMSWQLAAAALIVLPPIAAASFYWLRRVRPIYRSTHADRTEIDARVNETFGGIRVVRSFRREPHEERSYAVGHHAIIRKKLFAERLEMVLEGAWGVLIPATVLTVVWYGGRLVLRHVVKIGYLFTFNIFVVQLLQPIWAIVSSVSQTQKSLAAMERVFETMEMSPDKPDAPDAQDAPRIVRELRFDHVSFEYREGVPVIRDFTLDVPGGAVVALVGPSGAGKTTLTDLVARFQDPGSGKILLNGIDLRKLRLKTYRSLLAVVPQEVFLFDGTVSQNIAYGRRGAAEEEVIDAAKRANAHGFISQLPEGYRTLIGERGFKLSGGQRQRLSIARAILADPQILILDEATSNLDTESEQLIQLALGDLLRARTTFVIAHRLSTITHADIIVAMEDGAIREVGRHDELMERRGLYFEMVERQRQSFGEIAAESLISKDA
jgi:ATP-binding cassette subfamily B protein/subfamily B ATP-binding cassette protein MsbA